MNKIIIDGGVRHLRNRGAPETLPNCVGPKPENFCNGLWGPGNPSLRFGLPGGEGLGESAIYTIVRPPRYIQKMGGEKPNTFFNGFGGL
jgi:hypothetical protein